MPVGEAVGAGSAGLPGVCVTVVRMPIGGGWLVGGRPAPGAACAVGLCVFCTLVVSAAATADTAYTDGTTETFGHCERPHVIFDESGTKPIALTNGVKLTQAQSGLGNDDQSFTLLRPLAT